MEDPQTIMNLKSASPTLATENGKFNKYLQVRIGRQVLLASVDSGNGIQKAISCDLAKKLKLREPLKYRGPTVGTVKKGQPLRITRVLKNIKNIILQMMDSL